MRCPCVSTAVTRACVRIVAFRSAAIFSELALAPWPARLANAHEAAFTPSGEIALSTEPAALERVLANLLENARRHAPASLPQLVCSRGRDGMHIDVLDRGPGIPPDHLDKVFDPFYRVDPARQTPGTGLGFAIVREICRSHAWRIQLGNRPGGGLQARLTLPASLA